MMLGKRLIFLVVGLGAFLMWLALVIRAGASLDATGRKVVAILFLLGTLFGFGGSVAGALGSPKTDGHQNQGLLVLAGFFLLTEVLGMFILGFLTP